MPVIGLGTLCLTSQTLKQMGLKRSSMPFDWIFSSPGMVEHAIRDDFKEFLSRSNLKTFPLELRADPHLYQADNIFYRDNFGVKYIFNHHNPDTSDADYDYFRRCVDRFRSALRGGDQVFYVMFQHFHSRPDDANLPTYESIAKLLHPHHLLCVETFYNNNPRPKYYTVMQSGNFEIGRFEYCSSCNGLNFGSFDDYDTITNIIEDRRRRLDLISDHTTALAQANARTEAVRTVLSAVLASQSWRGLDRKKFLGLIEEASRLVPNAGPLSVQHEVLLAESRKVLNVKD